MVCASGQPLAGWAQHPGLDRAGCGDLPPPLLAFTDGLTVGHQLPFDIWLEG